MNRIILLTAVFVIIIFLLKYLSRLSRIDRLIALLPGPYAWPIIGNYNLLVDDFRLKPQMMYRVMNKLSREYEKEGIFKLRLGLKTIVVITSADYLETLTKEVTYMKKGPEADLIRPFAGDGIFNTEGEKWRYHRKVSNGGFSLAKLNSFIPIFNRTAKFIVEELEENPDIDHAHLFFGRATLDNVLESTMGVNFDVMNHPQHPLLLCAIEIKRLLGERIFNPILRYDAVYNWTKNCRKYWDTSIRLREFAAEVFDARKKKYEANISGNGVVDSHNKITNREKMSMLDEMLKSHLDMNIPNRLSKTDVLDTSLTFILAAEDTTAAAIQYTLAFLAEYPEVQKTLKKELDRVLIDSDEVTKEHLPELTYLDAVIRESMRLRPPVSTSMRILDRDIMFGKYLLAKGTSVTVYFPGVHNRYDIFGADVDEFRPERWLVGDEKLKSRFVWLPFSCGPRKCPGDVYAMMSLKIMLAHLMKNYSVELLSGVPELKMHILILPVKPISVRFIRRSE